MKHVVLAHFFLLALLFLISCGSSGSSPSTSSGIIITSPDDSGTVFIVGTTGAVPGEGTVTASNLSLSVPSASKFQDTGCGEDSDSVHTDGSFVTLSICAEVAHQIQLTHTDANGISSSVDTLTVPSSIASVCTSEGERPFIIINNSDVDIWLGVTAGTMSCLSDADCPTSAMGSCQGADATTGQAGTCACPNGNECGTVAQCNTNNTLCYWNLPELGISQMNLPNSDGHTVICFPAPPTGKRIQWSGNMFARTGCNSTGQACETGECNSAANGACPTGTGGNPPATLFEFTFSNQTGEVTPLSPDFYDISIINGINLALAAGPVSGTFEADSSDPYSCGNAGSTTQSGSLDPCTWAIQATVEGVDRTTLLRDVAPTSFAASGTCPNGSDTPNSIGFCECTSDADCSAENLLCGNALNASSSQQYTNVCGTPIGWWTADQLCGSSINTATPYGAPLNCASTVTNSDNSTSTYTNLHICTKPVGAPNDEQAQSCYNNAAISDCCGCATSSTSPFVSDWPSVLSPSFPGSDGGCFSSNTNWETIVQPWLVFLKKACPTAYTYPFDDATSTFTCQGGDNIGPPAYEMTFFSTQ